MVQKVNHGEAADMKKQTQKITKTVSGKAPAKKAAPTVSKTKNTVEKSAPAKKAVKTVPAGKTVKAAAGKAAVKTPAEKTVRKTVKPAPVKASAGKAAAKAPAAEVPHEHEHPVRKLKLSKVDKKYFRELLMHARASFDEQIQVHVDEALSSRKDSAGERAGMATHMADLGSDNFRHDFELGLLTDEVDVLEMIDEALQRIEDSEYGVCLDCGAIIPKERLEAKPYARYCTKCKSKREEMEDSRYHR